MKGILLPRNYLKFPLLKIIVRKIASKSLITSKNSHFLRMDHRNLVHENFWRDNGDIICIKNLFNSIRVINRTNCWAIWNCIGEDMDLFSKRPAFPPPFLKKMKLSIQYFQALVDSFIEILRLKHFMGARVLLIFHTTWNFFKRITWNFYIKWLKS